MANPEELAAKKLREHPTVPPSSTVEAVDSGELWPRAFCAFEGCMWEEKFGTEELLQEHLCAKHADDLQPVCECMLRGEAPDAMYSAYCEAIAVKCRNQAPLAGSSLDRTALNGYADAMKGDKVEALVCWCCGQIHPYVEEVAGKGSKIQWQQPLERSPSTGEFIFLGNPVGVVEELLGLQAYLSRYNQVSPSTVKLTDSETFEDWSMKLPGLQDGVLLCCPEEKRVFVDDAVASGPTCTHFTPSSPFYILYRYIIHIRVYMYGLLQAKVDGIGTRT